MTTEADRRHMERAVELMKQSRSEHESKLDPLVGAVLVAKNGESWESGRANLRVGDHAEYELIERLGHGSMLEGATLYVTLEPCRQRTPPKKGCAEWIVKARIGRVVVGVVDSDPGVNGQGLAYLAANRVEISHFDADLSEEIQKANESFLAQAKERSSPVPPAERFVSSGEEKKLTRASLGDLSPTAIERFLGPQGASGEKVADELYRRGYLERSRDDAELHATVAGVVCFGERPSSVLPQCCVEALRLVGGVDEGVAPEKVAPDGHEMLSGPLFDVIEGILGFFRRRVASVELVTGSIRNLVAEYPESAIREAVVNALVHRDYAEGRHAAFHMFRDCIRVSSPGLAPPPITLDQIRNGTARSMRRNNLIAEHARSLGQIDARGAGLTRMADWMERHGLARPLFDYASDYFVVTLLGRERSGGLNPEVARQLTIRQGKVVLALGNRGRLTVGDCAVHLGVDRNTAFRDLKTLVRLGIAESRGSGRSTYYVLRFVV